MPGLPPPTASVRSTTRSAAPGTTLTKSNAQFTHQDLAPNAEYRIRFADRVHRHLI